MFHPWRRGWLAMDCLHHENSEQNVLEFVCCSVGDLRLTTKITKTKPSSWSIYSIRYNEHQILWNTLLLTVRSARIRCFSCRIGRQREKQAMIFTFSAQDFNPRSEFCNNHVFYRPANSIQFDKGWDVNYTRKHERIIDALFFDIRIKQLWPDNFNRVNQTPIEWNLSRKNKKMSCKTSSWNENQ